MFKETCSLIYTKNSVIVFIFCLQVSSVVLVWVEYLFLEGFLMCSHVFSGITYYPFCQNESFAIVISQKFIISAWWAWFFFFQNWAWFSTQLVWLSSNVGMVSAYYLISCLRASCLRSFIVNQGTSLAEQKNSKCLKGSWNNYFGKNAMHLSQQPHWNTGPRHNTKPDHMIDVHMTGTPHMRNDQRTCKGAFHREEPNPMYRHAEPQHTNSITSTPSGTTPHGTQKNGTNHGHYG